MCTRTTCRAKATTTLTYVYADQTAVIGPLAPEAHPGSYDLCDQHATTTTAPRGWDTIRMPEADGPTVAPMDDLLALADAIREVGMRVDEPIAPTPFGGDVVVLAEKRHLRVIAHQDQ